MNMSGYEIEREIVAVEEYGDEVMCAGWNPQLELASDLPVMAVDKHAAFSRELANMDIDAFLQKMYKFQR
jgi:hypothetical protein